MRVKTRMEQLTESVCFTGGTVPYGYRLENCLRMDKKNREVSDLVIDEDAAEIIRRIFHKVEVKNKTLPAYKGITSPG